MIQYKRHKKSLTLAVAILIGVMFITFEMPKPIIEQTPERQWHVVWKGTLADLVMAESTPGSGVAGILEVFFVNHTATPDAAYATNSSGLIENWCHAAHLNYISSNSFDVEIAAYVNFDIVVRVRGNKSICGNSTGPYGIFRDDWLRVNITAGSPLDLTNQSTVGVVTNNVSTNPFIWMNFYVNDAMPGAGTFTLDFDQGADITIISFDAYY